MQTVNLLTGAGHTVVPQGEALTSLAAPSSAVWGALFIVMTAGLLVATLSIATTLLSAFIFTHLKNRILASTALWLSITGALFFMGESLFTQLYTSTIPLLIFYIVEKRRKAYKFRKPLYRSHRFFFAGISFLLASGLFYVQCDKGIFLRARDTLLLETRIGKAVNTFYYTNTLYAAQAIQSPLQQQIKTCWIDPKLPNKRSIKRTLARYGWLDIPDKELASFRITKGGDIPTDHLIKRPLPTLQSISERNDTHAVIRQLCLFGLILALPSWIFFSTFFSIHYLTIRGMERLGRRLPFLSRQFPLYSQNQMTIVSLTIASMAMIIISLGLIGTLYPMNSRSILHPMTRHAPKDAQLSHLLHHNSSALRVEALRAIDKKNRLFFMDFSKESPYIQKFMEMGKLDVSNGQWKENKIEPDDPQGNRAFYKGHVRPPDTTKNENPGSSHHKNFHIKITTAEKYWLTNIMGEKGDTHVIPVLKTLTKDPSINVQCSAIRALASIGQRLSVLRSKSSSHPLTDPDGRRLSATERKKILHQLINFLHERLEKPHPWYVQRAIYQSIKRISMLHY